MQVRQLVTEPLLHFFVVGALLFAVFSVLNPAGMRSEQEILVSQAQVASLSLQFERIWQRPPTESELQSLIDAWIREEVLYREGMAMGLDRDDQVIRRRIAQKMMLFADSLTEIEPSEEQLQLWLNDNAARYRLPDTYTLQQVYFDGERPALEQQQAIAEALGQLRSGALTAADVGDPILLPASLDAAANIEIGRIFGDEFVAGLRSLPVGEWAGPVRSTYGMHLVWIAAHEPGRAAVMAEVRDAVLRDFYSEQAERLTEAFYEALKSRYTVQLEAAS